tara:strand:+ start:2428 stop:2931 length:504 start_codon:yes stop_codon:yes gene_type:complete
MSKYTKAIKVIPSDTLNIPQPGVLTSGTSTAGAGADEIENTSAKWTSAETNPLGYNISGGDIIYNTSDTTLTEVSYVESDTVIKVSSNIFEAATDTYQIYKGNVGGDNVYDLLVGAAPGGDVTVVIDSGDEIVIPEAAMPVGDVIELGVIRVKASAAATAAKFVALQ